MNFWPPNNCIDTIRTHKNILHWMRPYRPCGRVHFKSKATAASLRTLYFSMNCNQISSLHWMAYTPPSSMQINFRTKIGKGTHKFGIRIQFICCSHYVYNTVPGVCVCVYVVVSVICIYIPEPGHCSLDTCICWCVMWTQIYGEISPPPAPLPYRFTLVVTYR